MTAINQKAFEKSKRLKTAVIGANVKSIGKSAFFKCLKLKSIKFQGKTVPSIGKKALKGISSKCKISYPKKISKKDLKKWKNRVRAAR